jgi:hypothetical protein
MWCPRLADVDWLICYADNAGALAGMVAELSHLLAMGLLIYNRSYGLGVHSRLSTRILMY